LSGEGDTCPHLVASGDTPETCQRCPEPECLFEHDDERARQPRRPSPLLIQYWERNAERDHAIKGLAQSDSTCKGMPVKQIAKEYNLTERSIWYILKGGNKNRKVGDSHGLK
jgi:hypothetical protein